jgi:hypothetical protein
VFIGLAFIGLGTVVAFAVYWLLILFGINP